MRFFSRFCLCWRSKERLDDEDTEENSSEQAEGHTTIETEQEASPESLRASKHQILSRLRLWNKRKKNEKHKIMQEDYPSSDTEINRNCELVNNDNADGDSDIRERSSRDSLDVIIF